MSSRNGIASTPVPEPIQTFLEASRTNVRIPGAEPVYQPRGEDAFLVLHGWCASAESVRFLTAGLAGAGFSTLAPTLPGHGSSPEDMQSHGPSDWIAAGRTAAELLLDHHRRVFLLGTSMGGALALQLAALLGPKVAGVVTVNAALFLDNADFALAVMTGPPSEPLPGWETTPFLGPAVEEITYSRRSRKSGLDLIAMGALAREVLHLVEAPLTILHSTRDQVVPFACAEEILRRASSVRKELVPLTNSLHAAQLDLDRDRIVDLAVAQAKASGVRGTSFEAGSEAG